MNYQKLLKFVVENCGKLAKYAGHSGILPKIIKILSNILLKLSKAGETVPKTVKKLSETVETNYNLVDCSGELVMVQTKL